MPYLIVTGVTVRRQEDLSQHLPIQSGFGCPLQQGLT